MKRTIATLILALSFLGIALPSIAQVQLGVVGGLNVSKLSYDNLPSNLKSNNRCGWYIGPKLEAQVPIVGLGFDIALEYSQRRMSGYDNTNFNYTVSKNYCSIEIPINVRYSIGLSSLAQIYASTGPQFGFNVGYKTWSWSDTEQYKLKKANVTWNVAIGTKLLKHVEAQVGYNFALSKFAKQTIGASTDGNIKAGSWQVQLAYLF